MNQWIVPKWNQAHQPQQEEDASRSSHVHFPHKNTTFSHNLVPTPKSEAMERTWESGDQEAAVDGHGEELLQMPSTKHSWGQSEDTLESIVHSSLLRKRTRSNSKWKDETFTCGVSLESQRSFRTKNSIEDLARDDGSAMHKLLCEEEHNMKGKANRSCSIKRTLSERRRRDRINQKLKDLQKLVPITSKTDRASLLDDTIQYLKQLQAQVQLMCSIRSDVPQVVMPLGMQQLQVSLLAARMGLLDTASMAPPSSSSFPCAAAFPPILLPSTISPTKPKSKLSTDAFVPPTDPFCTFLAQSMDMDFYSKMVTLYCQEVNRAPRQASKLMESQCVGGIEEDMHQS